MLSGLLLFMGFACCVVCSVFLRMRHGYSREAYVLSSPFAEAVRQLVGVAGGIYLSLVMLTGFLGLNLPERVIIQQMELDPLALFAIGLACVQPMLLNCWHRLAERGD